MLHNKYKFLRNFGLLPKIQHKQSSNITTFALINRQSAKQYHLQCFQEPNKEFCLFNDKQYLHRKCSHIFEEMNTQQIINELVDIYPKNNQSLTIFIVNEPNQCDKLLLGDSSQDSMISLIYRQMDKKREMKNKITLSIFGIESENSLTDQLNYTWIDEKQEQINKYCLIQSIETQKQKIKVGRSLDGTFNAQNAIRQPISSNQHLGEILTRYKQVKTQFQEWILKTQFRQYYLLGQIYQLSQVQIQQSNKSSEHLITKKIISTHFILRINQYIRTTSSLMLRLSITLKKWINEGLPAQIPQNKVFKIIFECFSNKNQKKKFHIHLFLQIGQYKQFKEQYLCLVPVSQFLILHRDGQISEKPFFYTKQYTQYSDIVQKIKNIQNKQINKQFEKQIQQSFLDSYKKIYSKSYVTHTVSSIQKKNKKIATLPSEIIMQNCKESDLEQLVNETIKIYRQPSNMLLAIKQEQPKNKNIKYQPRKSVKINLLQKITNHPLKERQTQFKKQKRTITQNHISYENQQQVGRSLHKKGSKFYEQTKCWLDHVYGKNMNRSLQKIKKKDRDDLISQIMKKQ